MPDRHTDGCFITYIYSVYTFDIVNKKKYLIKLRVHYELWWIFFVHGLFIADNVI